MKIIIDLRNTYKSDQALRVFTWQLWRDYTSQHPNDSFVLIKNDKNQGSQAGSNTTIMALPQTGIQWLDRWRLKKKLRSVKANRLVNMDADSFAINIQSVNNNGNVETATSTKIIFTNKDNSPAAPSVFVYPAHREVITALSWTESESIKTQYTGGRAFFLFTGNIDHQHRLIELLKAFSKFKKWQQSNMQLVIAGSTTGWTAVLEEQLRNYKYRNDVVLLKNANTETMSRLVAGCYALVYPSTGKAFPLALLWAVQSHKAAIATDNPVNRQYNWPAAWVNEDETEEGFAKAMILLYKDEQQLQQLVQQAVTAAALLNRQQMMQNIAQAIEQ